MSEKRVFKYILHPWIIVKSPNLKNWSRGSLKTVFNFSKFKPMLNWNGFLGDLRRGLNLLNSDRGFYIMGKINSMQKVCIFFVEILVCNQTTLISELFGINWKLEELRLTRSQSFTSYTTENYFFPWTIWYRPSFIHSFKL